MFFVRLSVFFTQFIYERSLCVCISIELPTLCNAISRCVNKPRVTVPPQHVVFSVLCMPEHDHIICVHSQLIFLFNIVTRTCRCRDRVGSQAASRVRRSRHGCDLHPRRRCKQSDDAWTSPATTAAQSPTPSRRPCGSSRRSRRNCRSRSLR